MNVSVGNISIGLVEMFGFFGIIIQGKVVIMKNDECPADVGLILIYSME